MSKKDDIVNKYLISNKVIRIYNILFWILSLQIVIGSYFGLIASPIYNIIRCEAKSALLLLAII